MQIKSKRINPLRNAGLLFVALLILSGCSNYRLGTMLPPDIKYVYVPTFVNQTDQPLLEVNCTQAASREILKDGSLTVVNQENADCVLTATIKRMTLTPIAYDTTRPTAAQEYRLTIYAGFVLKSTKGDKVLAENPETYGEATFPMTGDLTSSKQIAIPKAAQDLARRIVNGMVQAW